mmetsp:Transcript_43726/g.113984  ORF Transcript_43726/g.113984 Transcript_43726/m.113984 type:complete len:194 (-) Transcript_43726:252-833(-)
MQCFHTYTTHVLEQLSVTRCLKTSQQGLDGEHFAIPFLRCLTSLNVSYLLLMSFCLSPICVRTHREKPTHKFAISPFYFCHISHSHSHPLPLLLSSAGSDRARRPLISWMGTEMPSTIPVTILYGQRTWMNIAAGRQMAADLARTRPVNFEVVSAAGHNLFVDNKEEFNHLLVEGLKGRLRTVSPLPPNVTQS